MTILSSFGGNFLGIDFRINPMLDNVPRMTPSPEFVALMPSGFGEELRKWMLEFFGTEDQILSIDNGRTIFCGPRTMRRLRETA